MIEKISYSKVLSSLFSSISIVALTFLCLLNNLSFDIYSAGMLLRVVIPAAFCFWFLGFSMGHVLDDQHNGAVKKRGLSGIDDEEAYQIPSMFSAEIPEGTDSGIGDI